MVAVAMNIATVAASGLLLYHVGKRIGIPALPACALVLSLLLYPPYFDEVFTGRSIPFAILLFFAACYFYLRQQHFFSGILLGVSALVRFDFLVVGLLFQVMALFLGKKTRIQLLQLQIGFILGILPWVIYSYTHFNKLWISDNSWVALSAVPVFVLDYPAEATVSVNQAPVKWFFKVVSNTLPLSESILSSALLNPLLILTLAFAGWSALKFKYRANFKVIVLMALIFASTAPYLLTGYINPRYFSLFFVSIAAVLVYTNSRLLADADFIGLNFLGLTLLSVLITIPIGGVFLLADTLTGARKIDETHNQLKLIQTLKACHETERHKTYVFMKEGGFVAPRYGAVTGMRTAYIPSNFESMNESQKLAFLDVMKPYVLFDSLLKVEQCAKR